MKISKNIIGILIVIVLFAITAYIRLPYLNSSLGDHHEWVHAHALIALENLYNYPAKTHLFRLISTYPGEKNTFLFQSTLVRHIDGNGIGYYTSYPSFSVIFAYTVFNIFKVLPSVLSLQYLHIAMHGITALLLYKTVFNVVKKNKLFCGVVGSTIYLFATPNLWFLSVTYSWDTFWFYLVIINTFILSLMVINPEKYRHLVSVFGAVNILTILTELQGLFFVLGIVISSYLFDIKLKKKVTKIAIFSSMIAILALVYQTSFTIDFLKYVEYMVSQFLYSYGSFSNRAYNFINPIYEFHKYQVLAVPTAGILLISIALIFIRKSRKISKTQAFILSILIIPIFLHTTTMFPDVVVHEFALVLFVILVGFLFSFAVEEYFPKISPTIFTTLIICICFSFIHISLKNFKEFYHWAAFGEGQDQYEVLAKVIKNSLKDNEVLFIKSERDIPPMTTYYLKRNHQLVSGTEQAKKILTNKKQEKGKIYTVNKKLVVTNIETISNE